MLAILGVMLLASSPAWAAPQAPVITENPSNPNTTQANVTFEFEGAAGDPEPATMFECRAFETGNPPGGAGGWYACESPFTFDGDPLPAQPNGNRTFEVRGKTGFFSPVGPAASYDWVQNITGLPAAPVFTTMPDNPSTETLPSQNAFELEFEDIANGVRCRLVVPGAEFDNCASGYLPAQINRRENGTFTVEARAYNQNGNGPVTSYTFEKAIPDAQASMSLDEASSVQWGPKSNLESGNIGVTAVSDAGDINGDGRNDLVARTVNGTDTYVLFTPQGGANVPDEKMSPKLGYKITHDNPGGTGLSANGIGDQNGDGVRDLLLTEPNDVGMFDVYVVYGVSNPAALPLCNPASASFNGLRCQDISNISPDEGYSITDGGLEGLGYSASNSTSVSDAVLTGVGDVNGDDIEDILVGAPYAFDGVDLGGAAWVIMGGREAPDDGQPVDVLGLPGSEAIRIEGRGEGFGFGGLGGSVGDIDGDGLGDFAVSAVTIGAPENGYIFLGKNLDSSPISTADFGPSYGYEITNNPFGASKFFNVGDLNGDGQADLMSGGPQDFLSPDNTLGTFFLPDTPNSDPLFASSLAPAEGYSYSGPNLAGNSTMSGVVNLGDVNGDGVPDQAIGAPRSTVNGVVDSGATFVTFGRTSGPDPNEPIGLVGGVGPEVAKSLLGTASWSNFSGQQVVSAGDQDGDGLNDFWVTDVNSTRLVLAKNVVPSIKVGQPSDLSGDGAKLHAAVGNTQGEGQAHVEWGTTSEYGNQTASQAVDGTNLVSVGLTGLQPDTEYHYRVVVTDGQGLVKYGEDHTFNTGPKYDHCSVVPTDCKSGGGKARLAMITMNKKIKVKRGKRGVARVAVVNTGGEQAKQVKVCVKAPKKLVKVKRCFNLGSLGSGKTRTVAVKVQVKRKVKRGKKAVLKLTASGRGLTKRKGTVRVIVR